MENIYNVSGDIIECQHCGKRFKDKSFVIGDEPKEWKCPKCGKWNKSMVVWKIETIAINKSE